MIPNNDNICFRCKSEDDRYAKLKKEHSKGWWCPFCSYPLDYKLVFKRIKDDKGTITEIYNINMLHADTHRNWEPVSYGEAMEMLLKHDHLASPEYEDRDFVVVSVLHNHYLFHFGRDGDISEVSYQIDPRANFCAGRE